MNASQLIEPERHAVWIVAGFVLALLALLMSAISIYRINATAAATQAQVVFLNKKVEQLQMDQAKAPAPVAGTTAVPAPATPAK